MTKKKLITLIIDFISVLILVAIDQYTKALAVAHLKDKPAFTIIDGVLELNYLENKGAAFGMLQNQKIFFVFVAVIIIGAIGYILFRAPEEKKYRILHVLLVLIASGAIGNMIDRLRINYVIDFIYFAIINFPIFNVADIYVTVSTISLLFVFIFVYKEKDLDFISFKKKMYREIK